MEPAGEGERQRAGGRGSQGEGERQRAGGRGSHVRYQSTVTGVGELAGEFFAEGIVVLFGDDAPEELREVAVVHAPQITDGGLEPGDRIVLGDAALTVTAVGPVANENLVNLGHLVIKRNGATTHAQPGDVCCDQGVIPALAPGDEIRIEAGS